MKLRPPSSKWAARAVFFALAAAACLAQDVGLRPDNVAAVVKQMDGRVSVMRGSVPWALGTGDSVKPREVIVTGPDGSAVFQVNDGSTFWVFPNSRVTFRNDYSPSNLLDVIIGKIKVHIQRWGGQPNNTSISTPTAVISVRGTTFDVDVDPQDDSTFVAVDEGEVHVKHLLMYNERPRVLRDGDQIRVYRNVPLAKARIDKGAVAERAGRALMDAFYTLARAGSGRTGGAGGGPTIPGGRGPVGDTGSGGDSGSTPAPPPPGAPPPPPPQ